MYENLTADELMEFFESPISAQMRLDIDDSLYFNHRVKMEKNDPDRVRIERWLRRKRIATMRKDAKMTVAIDEVMKHYGKAVS